MSRTTDNHIASRPLTECLDFLATQPSSFVLQQLNAVENGCEAVGTRTKLRKLYEQYKREDYNSPTLLGALQMQVTSQCLSNLSEDGLIKAQQRILELEQELSNTKTALRGASMKPVHGTTMQPKPLGISAPPATRLSIGEEAQKSPTALAVASVLQSRKRKAMMNPSCLEPSTETTATPLKRGRPRKPLQPVKQHLVRLRQPEARDGWYSAEIPRPHEDWTNLGSTTKRAYSNIGHIEETDAGQLADEPCTACEKAGYTCKMYNPTTVALYCGQLDWQTCSRCHYEKSSQARFTPGCTLAYPNFICPLPAWPDTGEGLEDIDMDKLWSQPLQIGKPKESSPPLW